MKFFRRHIRKLKFRHKVSLLVAGIVVIFLFIFAVILGPFRLFFWDSAYLAGMFGPKQYLVLLQNNSELRPGGGFISGYGVVKMTFGVPSVTFKDSYSIATKDYVKPPYPFEKLIGDDPFYAGWQFRDANFSPDFPTSAKQALAFYAMEYPDEKFVGVVAMDFEVVEDLLDTVGGIQIGDTVYTSDNFFVQVQRSSKNIDLHNEEALAGRKNILSDLAQSLVKKAISSPLQYGKIVDTLAENMDEKHIMVYSPKNGLQEKLSLRGWDGDISSSSHSDVLHVNTANIGGRKADRYVQKRYEYTVTFPQEGVGHARLIATYTHQGDYNLQSDRYQAYVRTYVPLGSKLTRSDTESIDDVQIAEDLGLTSYGNTLVMMPGERRVFIYEYDLPASIVASDYSLDLIKQAGVIGDDYLVTVRMPNDHMVTDEGSMESFQIRENIASWKGVLEEDLTLRLQKQKDVFSPLVQWQNFRNLRTINVRFNELLDSESVSNVLNYDVMDLNIKDSVTDTVSVTGAYLDGMDLLINVSGIRNVPEERFKLVMRNLRDLSGNTISPHPMEITVVLR